MHIEASMNVSNIDSSQPHLWETVKIEDLPNFLQSIEFSQPSLLALSGGLDSRFLLSKMLESGIDISCCSYGKAEQNLDSLIARNICKAVGIEHQTYGLDKEQISFSDMENHQKHTYSYFIPLSAAFRLQQNRAAPKGIIILDGGFGEIFRGAFLKKLQLLGKKALKEGNAAELIPYLSDSKPIIFHEKIRLDMQEAAIAELQAYLNNQTKEERSNIDQWVKEYSFRSRLPNFYAPEQLKNDHYQINLMPFCCDPILIPFIYSSQRKLSFKQSIQKKELRSFPLVKGPYRIAYHTPDVVVPYLLKLKSKLFPLNKEAYAKSYFNSNTEIAHDWIDPLRANNFPEWAQAFEIKAR